MRLNTSGVVIVLGLVLSGCSASRPTGPTPAPIGQISAQVGGNVAGAAWRSGSTSVSWSCFSGGSGCLEPRLPVTALDVSAVITSAPTNVQQLVQGNSVTLSWAPPSGAAPTSYVIEAGLTPGASQFVFDTGTAQTLINVQGVPNGTYYARIRGRDASGVGPASSEITVVVTGGGGPPCFGPPGVPANVVATIIGSVAALTWMEPTTGCEPQSYVIQVGSSPGLTNIAQVDTGSDVRSYSVTGVPAGTYYVRVRARIGSTVGSPSSEVSATVTGIAPPGTTTWVGLVANGDGVTINNDPDCGFMRLDLTLTLVQSGSNVTGIGMITISQASPACSDVIGFRDAFTPSGTTTGTLASGSGTFTAIYNAGTEDEGRVSGSFDNGRMTGSLAISDGTTGTFTTNRQ